MATVLEEHAEASAEKKGLEGEARKRYIGGIFEKVRQAHAKATPEGKKRIEARVREAMRQHDEARKQREEEEARRKAHPLAGYWDNPNTPERQALLAQQKEEARKEKARQALIEHPISERTETKRAREAYNRLLAKYHNPKLQEERAAAKQEYQQLEEQRRKAHYSRYSRHKSSEEERLEKRMKALDSKYGFTEEAEEQQAIAEAEAQERRRQEEEERQQREQERQAREKREAAERETMRERVRRERDSWYELDEADVKRKEKAFAEDWNNASKERERLRAEGKTDTPEYTRVQHRSDLARLRYQYIDAVLADKQRPAIKKQQEAAYRQEYLDYIREGRAGKKPREGYTISFDEARKLRGEAQAEYNREEKARAAAGVPRPTIPPGDTSARVQGDYNKLWQSFKSDREKNLANFYIQRAMGQIPPERSMYDPSLSDKRNKEIEAKATALGERSKALLEDRAS